MPPRTTVKLQFSNLITNKEIDINNWC